MTTLDARFGAALADLCEEAADLVRPLWKSGLVVDRKSDDSPVTEADRRAETLILAGLARLAPEVPVVSEEHASEFGAPGRIGRAFLLVDPIDGTKAFVRGDPNFTVNIGLIVDGAPVAGAISAPATGETWFTSGQGVLKRINGGAAAPVRVRVWPEGAAIALVSHTMKPQTLQALADRYGFHGTDAMDSSIKFCRLAEGAADIYPRHGPTMEWDIAAGHAILAAAGGRVEAEDGGPFLYGKAKAGFLNGGFVARGG
ncbi:MAG: 3'(2'),5'-bisphosphate nucleotidase CysQ [Phenylobacterium sp.]|jgi:3'(2'), 5'-bisphosphate nucleotidase|nr:3'(2'),5'-bisphosphate nucleotidase CysQ [Phenylobacterium sp.]